MNVFPSHYTVVRGGCYVGWQLSWITIVRVALCPRWQLSQVAVVLCSSCLVGAVWVLVVQIPTYYYKSHNFLQLCARPSTSLSSFLAQ